MPFKLSNLNSNLALTPGYLNPALNNSALECKQKPDQAPKSKAFFPKILSLIEQKKVTCPDEEKKSEK